MQINLTNVSTQSKRSLFSQRNAGLFIRQTAGVTLIELMVVLVILGIVATIAVANYTSYLTSTKRTDAKTALLQIQVAEEKYFLQNNSYGSVAQLNVTSPTPGGNYLPNIVPGSSTNWSTYLATETAIGAQAADTACPTLTIDDQGTHGPTATAAVCWK